MSTLNIAFIVGSLRQDSINRSLARAIAKLAPAGITFHELNIGDLPLYNQDHDSAPAASVTRLKSEIAAADGLIFLTPEYNRSIPGVLKNAIDHASRPYGQSAWSGKPAGVLGASIGPNGTAMAQQHLRNILAYLDCPHPRPTRSLLEARRRFLYCRWPTHRRPHRRPPPNLARTLPRLGPQVQRRLTALYH